MSELQKKIFDAATRELCASVMENEGLGIKDAMRVVYDSRLYADLSNPDTGLYREGPVYLYDMLREAFRRSETPKPNFREKISSRALTRQPL